MRHFATEKFKSFLLAGTFSAVVGYLGRLIHSIVAGHVIGEDALAGVNMAAPMMIVVTFVAYLIAVGTANNYSIWMGRLDRVRARGFFTQGLLLALVCGAALSAVMYFGEDRYLALLSGSEYVEMYGRQYLDWMWPVGFTKCLMLFLALFCYADGDFRLCPIAYGVVFITNAAVSYVAVDRGLGASGCALGTVVSESLGTLVLCVHFFRKINTAAVTRRFALRDSWHIARASFGNVSALLCDAVLFFVVNKLVISRFDSDLLPVAGVAIALWGFLTIFNGVGYAVQPLVAVYWGERNTRAIRKVMQAALIVSAAEGLLLAGIFLSFPDVVVWIFGVEYPELVAETRVCVRLLCCGFLPLAIASLLNSYYLFIERPLVSVWMTLLCYLVMPVSGVAVGSSFGLNGIWVGMGLGSFFGVVMMSVAILARRGRHGFPLLLPRQLEQKIVMFDLVLTEEEIVRVSKAVAAALPGEVASRAALMVEEVFMTVRERNPKRKRILGEVTLDLNDGLVMTLRDDGIIFDITDADARISSLRTYLVASVMRRQCGRLNMVTAGFNRNVFRFA